MNQMSFLGFLALFLFCFVLSAFFSASEMAYSGINKIRVKRFVEEGRPGAVKAQELLRDFTWIPAHS